MGSLCLPIWLSIMAISFWASETVWAIRLATTRRAILRVRNCFNLVLSATFCAPAAILHPDGHWKATVVAAAPAPRRKTPDRDLAAAPIHLPVQAPQGMANIITGM